MTLEQPGRASVRGALAALSLSMLMASLDTSIANTGLPTLARTFSASFQQVQWIVLAYLLAVTTLIVSVGRLGDLVGRRKLLLVGISVFTASSIACGMASTLWLLVVARSAQGLGAAIMMALTIAFVSDAVPKEKVGAAMGLLGTMSAIGTALGPSLGGLLISGLGWRTIFLVNLPIGIVALLLARRHLPHAPLEAKKRGSFDPVGTVLLGFSLAAYALAMTVGRGTFGPLNLGFILSAAMGLVLFGAVETRVKAPLLEMSIFKDPVRTGGLTMSLLVSTVIMATLVVGPFYLARGFMLDPTQLGLLLSIGPLVVVLAGVPAGRLADRAGALPVSLIGLGAMSLGAALLAVMPPQVGVLGYLGPLVVLTGGYALFQTANNTVVMAGASAEQRGVLSGVLSLSRNLGLITGASVMGAVFAFATGSGDMSHAAPAAVTKGMHTTFALATAFIVAALAVALASRTSATRRRSTAKAKLDAGSIAEATS